MMNESVLYRGFEAEGEQQFSNLLNDMDFAYYYWTLPFCNL